MGKQSRSRLLRSVQNGFPPFLRHIRPFDRCIALSLLQTELIPPFILGHLAGYAGSPIIEVSGIEGYVDSVTSKYTTPKHLHESLSDFGRAVAPFPRTVLEHRGLGGFKNEDWIILCACVHDPINAPGVTVVGEPDDDPPGFLISLCLIRTWFKNDKPYIGFSRLEVSLLFDQSGICSGFDFFNAETGELIDSFAEFPIFPFVQVAASLAVASFSVMNNPTFTLIDGEPNRRYAHKFSQITGRELTRYKILSVKMDRGKRLQDSGKATLKDIMPLHDVRAHWRNAPDHPVSNFRGVRFIPSHSSGNAKNGVVVKDYKVKPPADESAAE